MYMQCSSARIEKTKFQTNKIMIVIVIMMMMMVIMIVRIRNEQVIK